MARPSPSRRNPAHIATRSMEAACTPSSFEEEPGPRSDSAHLAHPSPASQPLQQQLVQALQDSVRSLQQALEESRVANQRLEDHHKEERRRLEDQLRTAAERESRAQTDITELRSKVTELESRLSDSLQQAASSRRPPLTTEIHLDPLPAYPIDSSMDPQEWFINLETKGDFPMREDDWKVKALLKYLPDQYHAELFPLLSEPGPRYQRLRDYLIVHHAAYGGDLIGFYAEKLDDLKRIWVNPTQMRGYLLKLRNLQPKMCAILQKPMSIWDDETLRRAYMRALPPRMSYHVIACAEEATLTLEQCQARAEAFARAEQIRERQASQSTAAPSSILLARSSSSWWQGRCHECGSDDHWVRDCPDRKAGQRFNDSERGPPVCRVCKKKGHLASSCWFRDKPRCSRCRGFGHFTKECREAERSPYATTQRKRERSRSAEQRRTTTESFPRGGRTPLRRSQDRGRRVPRSRAFAHRDSSKSRSPPKKVSFACKTECMDCTPKQIWNVRSRSQSDANTSLAKQESYRMSARVWGTIEGVRVKMLLDTGADENVIGKSLATKLRDVGVTFEWSSEGRIKGFSPDLGEVPVIATTEVLLRIGPVALRDRVVVTDSAAEEAIIRFGFQFLAKLIIDPISKCVRFAHFPEITLPLLERTQSKQLLKAATTVVIPARCEMFVDVHPTGLLSTPVHILPFHAARAMARRFTIAHGYAEQKPTQLLACNFSPRPCRIKKGTIIARMETCPRVPKEDDKPEPGSGARTAHVSVKPKWEEEMPSLLQTSSCLTSQQYSRLLSLLECYRDVFRFAGDPPSRARGAKATIPTHNAKPCSTAPSRMSPVEKKVVEKEIEKMQSQGIIEPSTSPWASRVVLVSKKDGSWRFCANYTKLNKVTVKDVYPLPRIDDLLSALQGASCFSTVDMASGYWQIPMAAEDKKKTAFTTHAGLFEFNVMPFGLCNAPAAFERLMDTILGGIKWTMALVYLDDIVVFSSGFDEHLLRLRSVFERFRNAGVKLNPKKCRFALPEVVYLGHIVNKDGIRPDPQKVRAVEQFPTPATTRDLRRFLGLAGYCRRFIKGFSGIAAPLYAQARKDYWEWSRDCEEAFAKLKKKLATAPLLHHPLRDIPFIIDCDASSVGWEPYYNSNYPVKRLPVSSPTPADFSTQRSKNGQQQSSKPWG